MLWLLKSPMNTFSLEENIWKALPGRLLLSSITDVDLMMVAVFTNLALPHFACICSTLGVISKILEKARLLSKTDLLTFANIIVSVSFEKRLL